jgi:hypothetical protein
MFVIAHNVLVRAESIPPETPMTSEWIFDDFFT